MEYANKAAMGGCSGLCTSNKVSSFLYPCADCRHFVLEDKSSASKIAFENGQYITDGLTEGIKNR